MASNLLHEGWSIKIVPIPVNISFTELAKAIDLPTSRVFIPKIYKNNDRYAWINDFPSKEEADQFVLKLSASSIFDATVKFEVNASRSTRAVTTQPSRQATMPPITPLMNQGNQDRRDDYNPTNRHVVRTSKITDRIPDSTMDSKQHDSHRHQNRTQDNYKLQQTFQKPQESGLFTVRNTTRKTHVEDKRPLCRFANKGNCRDKSDECKYRHQRCENFDSCSIEECLFAHGKRATPPNLRPDPNDKDQDRHIRHPSSHRSDSCSSMSSTQSMAIKAKPCLSGVKCFKIDCLFDHPNGWNPCCDGAKCEDYECTANHPFQRKRKCNGGNNCKISNCKFLHPNTRSEECSLRAKCRKWNCSKLHPRSRAQLCTDREECKNLTCLCLHPPQRATMLCPIGADCHDISCKLNHPPERPSLCDQPNDCANFNCTRLHGPDWHPCETGDECEDEQCTRIHSRERNIKLQRKTATLATINNNKKNNKSTNLKTLEQRMKDWEKAQLPILAYRSEFCQRLEHERVLIVTAETGSGKSTQLPQYAAEVFGSLVVCTQPRVVAALSLANRVAEEYDGKSVGESVGYQVGNANRVTGTHIMFMTDAALIRESQRDPSLKRIRVLIIDEAHERSLNTDIVIGMSKLLLRQRPDDFYVVIASATINPTRFLQFFDRPQSKPLDVKGRVFPVTCIEKPPPSNCSEHKLIESHIVPSVIELYSQHEGHTLVFLPGQGEIQKALKMFNSKLPDSCTALALYGSQSPEDQEKVIKFNDKNKRMVVFCTNVAETSLTIPNVRLVIDSGWAKEARYDVKRRVTVIETVRISRSSADQRKGRAGRTASGHCVRLYEDVELKRPNIEPEILRSSLDLVLLQLIRLGLDPNTFPFMDQPTSDVINQSVELLTKLKCIDERKITKRGELFTELGLDPRLSSFIVEIYTEYQSLLELAVGIVAILSAPGNIFFMGGSTLEAKQEAKERLALLAHNHKSDLIHLYSVYNAWKNAGAKATKGKCPECQRQIKYCICRIKHSNEKGLNNKILQNIDSSSATILKQIKNASWLQPGSEMPQNSMDIISKQLALFFPEQCGYLLVPQLPTEGARLISTDIRANIANASVFMQKLHADTNRELYQHFVAMTITQLTSGSYIIEKLHPIPRAIATAQSSIKILVTIENIGSEVYYHMRQKFNAYQSEPWAKWLVYQYDRVYCRFSLWGLENDKMTILPIVQRIQNETLKKLLEAHELLECGTIKANFQGGLICTHISKMTNALKVDLQNVPKQTVNELKIWLKKILDIEWDEIKEHSFYTPKVETEKKNSNDESKHLCLVFKTEDVFRRTVNKIPSYYMSEQCNDSGTRKDTEKEIWGRELIIETPDNVNDNDIINRYGADVIMKCLQLNKKDEKAHVQSSLKLNNLPIESDEAFLRECLRKDAGPNPKHVHVGCTKNNLSGWAKVTFADLQQRNKAAMIFDLALCQNSFPITIQGKKGPVQKFIQTTFSIDEDANAAHCVVKNRFRIILTSREVALRIFSSPQPTTTTASLAMATNTTNSTDPSQWTVDSAATVTIMRTDLYPDFEEIINRICNKFGVKVKSKDIPNFGKRCTFNHGSPQKTSLAASMLAQTFAPMNIRLNTDRQKALFNELEEVGEIQRWASELALCTNKNKYNTNIDIRGPQIAQGQLMRRIADYSDKFDKRFREYQLNATVAAFFGRQKAASNKLKQIDARWSSKYCSVYFILKTSTILIIGKPKVSLTDMNDCEKEVVQLLDEQTVKTDNENSENDDEEEDNDDDEDVEESAVKNIQVMGQNRQCVFCKQISSMSASTFRICGHTFCRCAAQALTTYLTLPLECKECKSNIHIRDIQTIFSNDEQLFLNLLKSSIQDYLTKNAKQDDRVFCPNDECDGLIKLNLDYQTCLTCGQNVCPKCQVIGDEVHVGRTCAQLLQEKKRREFLPQLFEEAKKFVQENWPTDANMVPIGRIDENPYLEKQYKTLKRFYEGIKALNHDLPPDLGKGFFAYHGTPSAAIVPICQSGFDPKRRSGQVYGPGEYFGVTASVSHGYAQRGNQLTGSNQMIIAYLLRGSHVKTVQNFCYVVANPTDWKFAFNLPVLIVTYGQTASCQSSPFPSTILDYVDDEPSWIAPFRWHWRQDNGQFEPYNDTINDILEKFYQQWKFHGGPSTVETPPLTRYLDDIPLPYRIDYENNKQTNTKTSYTRVIERRPMEKQPGSQNWFYHNEQNNWMRYELLVQNTIESKFQLYRSGQGPATIDIHFPGRPETYEINFLKGQQTNKTTNAVRNIKRE
ncbi:unnamed protein product [Rotaria magnacalcarata]|uniref:RNA helicase n=1 Tax=Rotaria magnacalcarata TaxID=392030 RepID=A0A815HCY3_9BILA|nr:unnamed protein product [Rotaria magnacalcarata]